VNGKREVVGLAGEALELGGERRAGGPRGPAERSLQRRAEIAEGDLDLVGAALSGRVVKGSGGRERHRDPEQALDDPLVKIAR
ncbi:hypothetical protein ABTM70_20440, partial [Acinetobacter baumannii]